jgi:hypothetical protein
VGGRSRKLVTCALGVLLNKHRVWLYGATLGAVYCYQIIGGVYMTFDELLQLRGEFGPLSGEALRVVEKSEEMVGADAESEDDTARAIARSIEANKLQHDIDGAVESITNAVNGHSSKLVAEAIFLAIAKQHRTLQAQTVDAFVKSLGIYQYSSYDLRNKAAVVMAERITEFVIEDHGYIPII